VFGEMIPFMCTCVFFVILNCLLSRSGYSIILSQDTSSLQKWQPKQDIHICIGATPHRRTTTSYPRRARDAPTPTSTSTLPTTMSTPSPPTSPLDHDADAEIDIVNGANHASPHIVALFLIRFDQKVGYAACFTYQPNLSLIASLSPPYNC
jgi:hypothetical protein